MQNTWLWKDKNVLENIFRSWETYDILFLSKITVPNQQRPDYYKRERKRTETCLTHINSLASYIPRWVLCIARKWIWSLWNWMWVSDDDVGIFPPGIWKNLPIRWKKKNKLEYLPLNFQCLHSNEIPYYTFTKKDPHIVRGVICPSKMTRVDQKILSYMPHDREMTMSSNLIYI